MIDLLARATLLAQDSPGGSGESPDSGVFIIVAIVVAVALGGFLLHALVHRFGRSRKRALESHPAPEGRVGRTSEFRTGEDG